MGYKQYDTFGIDLSHWNAIGPNGWRKMMENTPEVKFVILKATEGIDYVDPKLADRVRILRKLDIPFGFYHFVSPDKFDQQLSLIHRTQDTYGEHTRYFMDIESRPRWKGFDSVVASIGIDLVNKDPFFGWYSYPYFMKIHRLEQRINQVSYKWVASYSEENHFDKWDIWQYTSKGKVKGIIGNVDCNVLRSPDLLSKIFVNA